MRLIVFFFAIIMLTTACGNAATPEEPSWIEYDAAYLHIGLSLPAGWAYETVELPELAPDDAHHEEWGFSLWPKAAPEVRLSLMGQSSAVGLCGTGVKRDELTRADGTTATRYIYDNVDTMSVYIICNDTPGEYVLSGSMSAAQWAQYEADVTAIVTGAVLGNGAPTRSAAVERMRAICPIPGETWESFDFRTGNWTITVSNTAASRTYRVCADGEATEITE